MGNRKKVIAAESLLAVDLDFTGSVDWVRLTLFVPHPFGQWNLPKGDVDGTTIRGLLEGIVGRCDRGFGGLARNAAAFTEIRLAIYGSAGDFRTTHAFGPYGAGLVSNLERKNVEEFAYFHDQDRQASQKCIGPGSWDHRPLLTELARQVGAEIGEGDGVIIFDPSLL